MNKRRYVLWFVLGLVFALAAASSLAEPVYLDAPVVEAPESVVIGEPFTVTVQTVPGAEHYQLIIADEYSSDDIYQWHFVDGIELTVDAESLPGTMTVQTDSLVPGEYLWWVGVYAGTDVDHGNRTTGTFSAKLAAPVVEAPEKVTVGDDFTIFIEQESPDYNYQLILFDTSAGENFEDWVSKADSISYGYPENGTMSISTDTLTPGNYTWWCGAWFDDDVMIGDITLGTFTVLEEVPAVDPNSVIILNLPANLTKIEEEAFSGLTVQKVIINATGSVYIHPRAFADSSVVVVEIPNNVSFRPEGGIVAVTR